MYKFFDCTEIPFEIWCDCLEEEGIVTEELRVLFSHPVGSYLDSYHPYHHSGCGSEYGYGSFESYPSSAYGDGAGYGHYWLHAYGDGSLFFYSIDSGTSADGPSNIGNGTNAGYEEMTRDVFNF